MAGSATSFGITKDLEESSEWQYENLFDEMTDTNIHRASLWTKERIPFFDPDPFNGDSLYARLVIVATANDTFVLLGI